MARRCEICGKGTVAGNNVPRKGKAKKDVGIDEKGRDFRESEIRLQY